MLPEGPEGGLVFVTPLSSADTDTVALSAFPPGLHLAAAHLSVCVWGRGPGPGDAEGPEQATLQRREKTRASRDSSCKAVWTSQLKGGGCTAEGHRYPVSVCARPDTAGLFFGILANATPCSQDDKGVSGKLDLS